MSKLKLETGSKLTQACYIFQAHAERKSNADDLENSLKTLDNLCTKIFNAKYNKAVLQAKLTNLQKVAAQQEKLLAEVNQLESWKHEASLRQLRSINWYFAFAG